MHIPSRFRPQSPEFFDPSTSLDVLLSPSRTDLCREGTSIDDPGLGTGVEFSVASLDAVVDEIITAGGGEDSGDEEDDEDASDDEDADDDVDAEDTDDDVDDEDDEDDEFDDDDEDDEDDDEKDAGEG